MGKEIERKFLVNKEAWQKMEKPAGQYYRQGYLTNEPHKTIRVRLADEAGYLTIKGISEGATRLEYEYAIPINDARELLDNFSGSELSKIRYKIPFDNKIWEVDEFLGDNAGLLVAEIELQSEDEPFEIPDWVAGEVTGDEKYYNSNLTIHPYCQWNNG
ncbi:MAG: CYTH domain-containing protein [Chitinophagaceae bacterium]|nr:CYTH domain-containing protein [Chitinophagaceae bacterium]